MPDSAPAASSWYDQLPGWAKAATQLGFAGLVLVLFAVNDGSKNEQIIKATDSAREEARANRELFRVEAKENRDLFREESRANRETFERGIREVTGRPPTASSSPRMRTSRRLRPTRGSATRTCSLTASATRPTPTAPSATCST